MLFRSVDKMNYLTGLLKGEAARVIQGLPLSESNYQRAVDLLKERSGQKQVLINSHMDGLLKITSDKLCKEIEVPLRRV